MCVLLECWAESCQASRGEQLKEPYVVRLETTAQMVSLVDCPFNRPAWAKDTAAFSPVLPEGQTVVHWVGALWEPSPLLFWPGPSS